MEHILSTSSYLALLMQIFALRQRPRLWPSSLDSRTALPGKIHRTTYAQAFGGTVSTPSGHAGATGSP